MVNLGKSLVLSAMLLFSSQSMAFNMNQQSVKDLFVTYGYLYGQELILNKIEQTYPELKYDVANTRARFNLAFPNITNKTKALIFSINDKNVGKEFNDLVTGSNSKLNMLMNGMSKEDAVNFLKVINERANGNIDSPTLENILSIQYEDNPSKEVYDGFYSRYSSLDNYKSKGVQVNLKLPKSWQKKEAEKPNIVNKWISQNGNGNSLIMLMVKNTDGVNVTASDIEDFYKSGEVNEMAPEGFKIIDKGSPIVLEGQNGFRVKIAGVAKRLDFSYYEVGDMYNIFYKDKFISIQCMSGGLPTDKSKVDLDYQKVESLCKYVANSLTLPQRYN